MGVYKRGDSYYLDFHFRGERYTECVGPVSKTVAKERLDQRKGEAATGKLEMGPRIRDSLFEDALKKYLEYYQANRRSGSYQRHLHSAKPLPVAFGGSRRLSSISAFLIEKYKRDRKAAGRAGATISRELALLKNLFTKSVEWGFARENPVRKIEFYREDNAPGRAIYHPSS